MQNWYHVFLCGGIVSALLVFFSAWGTLEFTEIGLDYNSITRSVGDEAYSPGRYYLGVGHAFLKFPSTVQNVQFSKTADGRSPDGSRGEPAPADDSADALSEDAPMGWSTSLKMSGPPLRSRTKDGLEIEIEVSFQYQLRQHSLRELYTRYARNYHSVFVRQATDVLTAVATEHEAKEFFANRTTIARHMEEQLQKRLAEENFVTMPLFQFQAVDLEGDSAAFEEAIKDTQVADQKIKRVTAEQSAARVQFETRVIQAKKQVLVMRQQADAQSSAIKLQNDAYCVGYKATQSAAAGAFAKVFPHLALLPAGTVAEPAAVELSSAALDYMKIRLVRDQRANSVVGIRDANAM